MKQPKGRKSKHNNIWYVYIIYYIISIYNIYHIYEYENKSAKIKDTQIYKYKHTYISMLCKYIAIYKYNCVYEVKYIHI